MNLSRVNSRPTAERPTTGCAGYLAGDVLLTMHEFFAQPKGAFMRVQTRPVAQSARCAAALMVWTCSTITDSEP